MVEVVVVCWWYDGDGGSGELGDECATREMCVVPNSATGRRGGRVGQPRRPCGPYDVIVQGSVAHDAA